MDKILSSHDQVHGPDQAGQKGTMDMGEILNSQDPRQACKEETGMSFHTLSMGEKVSQIDLSFYYFTFVDEKTNF